MQNKAKNNNIILIKTLGDIIKSHRKASNKTIYKISAEASMSKSTWRAAELGICKNINLTTLWKISEGLEMSPSELLEELQNKLGKNFSLSELD